MPAVITSNGSRVLLGAALALTVLVVLGTAMIALFLQGQDQASCGAGGVVGGRPGPAAETIPAPLMPLYASAERTYGVPWNVLAAINKVETDFGRNLNVSSAGAIGWMQFMPDTWARYGVDGNDDGEKDPYDPEDAIPSAANYLRALRRRARPPRRDPGVQPRRVVLRGGHLLGAAVRPGTDATRPATPPGPPRPTTAPRAPRAIRWRGAGRSSRRRPTISARPLGNWQSDNAIDIAVPAGTAVLAVGDGTVERTGGSAPHRGGGVDRRLQRHAAHRRQRLLLRAPDAGRWSVRASTSRTAKRSASRGTPTVSITCTSRVQHGDPMTVSGEAASTTAAAPACAAGDAADSRARSRSPPARTCREGRSPRRRWPSWPRSPSIYGKPLIVTTGTNHSYYTVNGNVSDHFYGHAADIGMVANGGSDDGPVGDAITTACLIAAGDRRRSKQAREAQQGGLWTREHDGLRIQCIWKTDEGGNHHGHDHIGARPAAT